MSLSPPKDPRLVAAGRRTALMRWGEFGNVLRLNRLHPEDRAAVETILRARRDAEASSGNGQK